LVICSERTRRVPSHSPCRSARLTSSIPRRRRNSAPLPCWSKSIRWDWSEVAGDPPVKAVYWIDAAHGLPRRGRRLPR
jgi:hypothetical protein